MNSELTPQGCGHVLSLTLGIGRKLEDICQSLTLPAGQGDMIGFLTSAENVQRIDNLVEDVHEALMRYQVCTPAYSFSNHA